MASSRYCVKFVGALLLKSIYIQRYLPVHYLWSLYVKTWWLVYRHDGFKHLSITDHVIIVRKCIKCKDETNNHSKQKHYKISRPGLLDDNIVMLSHL